MQRSNEKKESYYLVKSLLLSLFITGAVSVEAQSAMGDSVVSQSNLNGSFNQSDRSCTKVDKADSCLLPNNLLGNINLYPSLFRQATNLLLPQWQSPLHPRKQVKLYTQAPSLLATKSRETEQHKYKTLIPQVNPLPPKFPSVSRSSLLLSAPNQKKIDSQSLLAHPAPKTKTITSPYGWRRRPYSRKMQFHKGIDYGAPLGSPVVAADDGVVIKVVSGCADFGNRWCGSQFGNWIEIDHGDGMVAIYAHLRNRSLAVRKGMKVKRNQPIAKVGSSGWSTGAHLDFRLKVNGKYKNPKDFVLVKK